MTVTDVKTLIDIFGKLAQPHPGAAGAPPAFSVQTTSSSSGYLVGKDSESRACLLIAALEPRSRHAPPIRLENLEAQFEIRCDVTQQQGSRTEGTFSVIRCRSSRPDVITFFFYICATVIDVLGEQPKSSAVASAIHRLASIFQRVSEPPTRSVNGLFGELFLIRSSSSPSASLSAWRIDENSRFDFSLDDVRLDVKASAGRQRSHVFTYEQCNPPTGVSAFAASLFIERVPNGITLGGLIREIEGQVSSDPDLVMKLHEVVAKTLLASLPQALAVSFDRDLAANSLEFYDAKNIPAIRGAVTHGVSEIKFKSDLSQTDNLSVTALIERHPSVAVLLP